MDTVGRMDALPDWPESTVAILGTGERHQIPVSLVQRAGDRTIVVGLARTRASLANLQADPRCAVTILATNTAFTAYGHATLEPGDPLTFARIVVHHIADHAQDTFEITAGVAWHWTDDTAARRDADAREAMRRLAR